MGRPLPFPEVCNGKEQWIGVCIRAWGGSPFTLPLQVPLFLLGKAVISQSASPTLMQPDTFASMHRCSCRTSGNTAFAAVLVFHGFVHYPRRARHDDRLMARSMMAHAHDGGSAARMSACRDTQVSCNGLTSCSGA